MGDASAGEVVSVHVGEAGVRVGAALWEALCFEHDLDADGTLRRDVEHATLGGHACFGYELTPLGALRARPRALFVDTADDTVNEVRKGAYRGLFPDKSLVSGGDGLDASCLFARAYRAVGRRAADVAVERMRCLLEDCDRVQVVQLYHSRGGGTGAGLTSRLAERFRDELLVGKELVVQLAVSQTSGMSTGNVVEPYNAALSLASMSDLSTCALHFDNSALLDACRLHLRMPEPRLANANHLWVQLAAALTASARHATCARADGLASVLRALVPTPRLKYALSSLAPLGTSGRATPDAATLTRQSFLGEHHLADFRPAGDDAGARYLACAMVYRGDVAPRDVPVALAAVRALGRFQMTPCPDLQVLMCARKPSPSPFSALGGATRACAQLLNTTAASRHARELRRAFCAMWRRRAFFQLFNREGLEEAAFEEALEGLERLETEYRDAGLER